MQTSSAGVDFLERHEGTVLKAYRDPVGVLTIGAGLTKASGVIDPKPGMTITKRQASELLAKALRKNYEPTVSSTLPGAMQHEFDGAVSFHFNTGAIRRASWVKAWQSKNWRETERRIKLWKKASGRVLPGLVRRRDEEFQLIKRGYYGRSTSPTTSNTKLARFALQLSAQEFANARAAFAKLGYAPGSDVAGVDREAVRKFQLDHDLTIDGVVGRATLSTLQRMIDARKKTKNVGQSTAAGGAGAGLSVPAGADAYDALMVGGVAVGLGALAIGYVAWRYRDAIAVKAQSRFPTIAKKLRSL